LRESLQGDHAPDEARLQVHHAIRVGEVARQLRVSALDDARPEAQVALLERRILRPALLLPKVRAARFPKLGRIAVLQRSPVLCDLIDRVALSKRGGGHHHAQRQYGQSSATMDAHGLLSDAKSGR
jgi:hypothetical protein